MVQLLFLSYIFLYVAVLVSILQVKIRIFARFHIVSHLPAVIDESTVRVEGKTSYFDRLFVHWKVSFIQLPSGAQILRAVWVLIWCWPRLILVWSEAFILTGISFTGIFMSSACGLGVLVGGVWIVGSVLVHCYLVGKRAMIY